MTDKVVYETTGKPEYVIQYETENREWEDTYPTYWSKATAIENLNTRTATPYPFRIVERTR